MSISGMYTEPEEGGRPGFPPLAASASLTMPVIAILISVAWRSDGIGATKATIGFLCVGCIGLGTVLAIIALCNAGRYEGLVRRGVLGLLFNGIFVALFGFGFVNGLSRGVKARQVQRELLQATENLRDNMRKSFSPETGLTNMNTADVARVREQLENAAASLDGQNALLAKTWVAYLQEVEAASRKWQGMYNELSEARVLDFSQVEGRQKLRDRQALVHRYRATSDAMRELVASSSDFFRDQLKALGASPDDADKALKTLEAQNAKQSQVLLQIRDLDSRISQDMLGILSLLETNWGSWSCPTGPVIFNDNRTLRAYNHLLADMRTAGQEQIDAQRKLVSAR